VYQLAQINIAKLKAPLEDPSIYGFVSKLDEVNALADSSKGFVWRLQEEDGSALNISVFDDSFLVVNMSLWESVEDLKNFVYKSGHVKVYLQKDSWFHKLTDHHMVLWWVKKDEIPDILEAKARLQYLRKNGPSKHAFTFKNFFEPEN
jgi:hypothetical protein